jgi:hypothetical protein
MITLWIAGTVLSLTTLYGLLRLMYD